ncbi:glutathione S-transferase family protein [Neisseria lisongii]|uniref:glutathione transferase n=1 Tax=Neisseria lisongii TaxID=2912188 RepID=A0AAW5AJW0_9NEIS|nr:glutathione S-transferase [Neisseria lisongii]MCF7528756.1 glutathione S-transferase [Neisseria lisongii]MCF7529614.1 glutathione S-transferase [Neisseria lisongii]
MITLHVLAQSRALRIVWLLELIGTPYQIKTYSRHPETMLAPDELKAVHPLGKSPVIDDNGFILSESGAITDYLIQTYGGGRFMPKRNSRDYWHYQRWLHYAEGSLMPLLLLGLVFRRVENADMPFFVKPVARKISATVKGSFIEPQAALHLAYIENELNGKNWLVNNQLSGADIMMSFPLQAASERFGLEDYPNIRNYLQRIENDPAYQAAVRKAGNPLLRSGG